MQAVVKEDMQSQWCYRRRRNDHQSQSLPSSGLLSSVRWFETDVSKLPAGHIFKGQALLGQLDL